MTLAKAGGDNVPRRATPHGPPGLVATPVTETTWDDFAALFEAPGGPSYCWCMAFRKIEADADPAARRAEMKRRVTAGVPVGLLLSDATGTIGWCSVAPRETYRGIGGAEPAGGERTWTIACLHLRRARRGEGLARRMIEAAEDYARAAGATLIEATPVEPDSPSYRFMGRVSSFAALGYEFIEMAGKRRHVMRKRLAGAT